MITLLLFLNHRSQVLHNFTDYPEGIMPRSGAIIQCSGCGSPVQRPIKIIYDRFKLMTNNPRIELCRVQSIDSVTDLG